MCVCIYGVCPVSDLVPVRTGHFLSDHTADEVFSFLCCEYLLCSWSQHVFFLTLGIESRYPPCDVQEWGDGVWFNSAVVVSVNKTCQRVQLWFCPVLDWRTYLLCTNIQMDWLDFGVQRSKVTVTPMDVLVNVNDSVVCVLCMSSNTVETVESSDSVLQMTCFRWLRMNRPRGRLTVDLLNVWASHWFTLSQFTSSLDITPENTVIQQIQQFYFFILILWSTTVLHLKSTVLILHTQRKTHQRDTTQTPHSIKTWENIVKNAWMCLRTYRLSYISAATYFHLDIRLESVWHWGQDGTSCTWCTWDQSQPFLW